MPVKSEPMRNILAEKIIGHDWAVDLLAQAINTNNFPQSLLITGLSQIGKFSLARNLAMALNCQRELKPCRQCLSCQKVLSGNHPDIFIFEQSSGALKINEIRQLQHTLSLRPHESPFKIAVLSDFERATTSAANALLKTLEEPPAHVKLILSARNINQLLPTIISRCQIVSLRPVQKDLIYRLLKNKFETSDEQATLLSHLALGRPGWAINALGNPDLLTQRSQYLTDLLNLTTQSHAARLAYAHKLAYNHKDLTGLLNLWLIWWRDVLLVNSVASLDIVNIDQLDNVQWLAQSLTLPGIVAAIKQTQAAIQNFNHNVNTRLNLEVLLLNLPYL